MIKIKLKELLESHDITISDLSDATGISRSTITPLVNSPEQVKGLNLDTIDTLCDFFGIAIDDLLFFTPTSGKYTLSKSWFFEETGDYIFLFKKTIGKRERHSFVKIESKGIYSSFTPFENAPKPVKEGLILITETTFLTKEETKKVISDIFFDIDINTFPEKNIFENDFSKQTEENIKFVTKLLAGQLIKDIPHIKNNFIANLSDVDIKYIEFNWRFTHKKNVNFEKYLFDIDKKEVITISDRSSFKLDYTNL